MSNTSRWMLRTAIACGVMLGGVVVSSSPVLANDGVCGPGDLCLYQHTLLAGGQWDNSGFEGDYSSGDKWWGTSTSINDQASSAKSRYSFWSAFIYEHSYYRGPWVSLNPGEQVSVLADYGMNDKASSNDY